MQTKKQQVNGGGGGGGACGKWSLEDFGVKLVLKREIKVPSHKEKGSCHSSIFKIWRRGLQFILFVL